MKTSDLINRLTQLMNEVGDVEVMIEQVDPTGYQYKTPIEDDNNVTIGDPVDDGYPFEEGDGTEFDEYDNYIGPKVILIDIGMV